MKNAEKAKKWRITLTSVKKGNLKVKTIQQDLDIDQDRLNEVLEKMQKDGLVKLNTNNLVEINPG